MFLVDAPIGNCAVKSLQRPPKPVQTNRTSHHVGYSVNVEQPTGGIAFQPMAFVPLRYTTRIYSTQQRIRLVTQTRVKKVSIASLPTTGMTFQHGSNSHLTVTSNEADTLPTLTDLVVTVKTQDGIPMPFVDLAISYRYQSGSISKSGSSTGQTDPSGTYTLTSTIAGATYTIDASLYGRILVEQTTLSTATPINQQHKLRLFAQAKT